MPASIIGNPAVVTGLYQAFNGKAAGYNTYTNNLAYAAQNGPAAYAAEIGKGFYAVPAATLADSVLKNVGIDNAVLEDALVQIFTAYPVQARGQIVLNLINLLTNLEGDATYGAAAVAWNQTVASNNAYSNNPTNLADQVIDTNVVTLTAGADTLAANVFKAARGYTPGGTDQVNTLNDDDVLTGTGVNATLNFTFVDDADLGAIGAVITPELRNVNTINIDFIGSLAKTLDLQDSSFGGAGAVNVSRINDTMGAATVDNMTSVAAAMSINNSNAPTAIVNFTYAPGAASGAADASTLTLNRANVAAVNIADKATVAEGVEQLTIASVGGPNAVAALNAQDLVKLTINGNQNLTIGTIADGNVGQFNEIDGSAATGNLNLTVDAALNADMRATTGTGAAVNFKLTTGSGNDVLNVVTNALVGNAADTIDLGAGNDTVAFRQAASTIFTDATSAVFNNVEAITVTRVANAAVAATTLTVDTSRLTGDQTIRLTNLGDATDGAATFALRNLSAVEAGQITITHSNDTNNAIADTVVDARLANAAGASDTVGLTIVDGTNSEARFNVTLTAGGATAATGVENITLTDSDTESNTVELTNFARHTGTITLTGGVAGQFLNLDSTALGYGIDRTGGAVDATAQLAAATPYGAQPIVALQTLSSRDTAVASVYRTTAGTQQLVAATIDATGEAADVIVRVGAADQNIQLGSGNDTVIFADRAGITASTAGLTISDTVAGGAGVDTLIFDGAGAQNLGASEWTNLSGVDTLRLAGAAGSVFTVQVTNQLVDQTDNGSIINIVNNDGDLSTAGERAATIDLTSLSATNFVNFQGGNGDGTAAGAVQTVLVNDVTANGGSTLNGGDRNVLYTYDATSLNNINAITTATARDAELLWNVVTGAQTAAAAAASAGATLTAAQFAASAAAYGVDGNANVYQVVSNGTNAQVTVGDLANTSNFSTINFQNDAAIARTLFLTLNDATVDRLVDASHTATAVAREVLTINALDNNIAPGVTVAAQLNIAAGTLSNAFNLVVNGGVGADVITTGAGNDVITGGAGADVMTGGLGADTFAYTSATIAGLTAEGGDSITDFVSLTDIIRFADLSGDVGFTVGTAAVVGETLLVSVGNAGVADINFVSGAGAVALSGESTLIFDTATRTLSFDADGNGAGGAVAIVTVGVGQAIVAGDIVIA